MENLSPQIIRQLTKELHELVTEPPEGIKVQINEEDITDIQAYIDGPGMLPIHHILIAMLVSCRPLRSMCSYAAFLLCPLAGTPYAGGVFRVKLALGKDFPQAPPKGFFLTRVFHPNVAKNGEICVNTLKKDWRPDLGIKHILLVSII